MWSKQHRLTDVASLFPAQVQLPVAAVTGIVCVLVVLFVFGREFDPDGGYER